MTRIFSMVAALLFLSLGLAAQAHAEPAPEDATRSVIQRQLDAFQRDAWDEAYGYAAPSIQRLFPSPETFSQMVTGGYPMVWRPSSVEFLDGDWLGGLASTGQYQHRLRLRDQAGAAYIATYTLRQVDGAWRISAVRIEAAPEAAV